MKINPERVKRAVYNRIDFEMPEHIWDEIDYAFAEYWNNVAGMFGLVDTYSAVSFIAGQLQRRHILLQFEKIITIVDIIWEYLEMTGGFYKPADESSDVLFPEDPDHPAHLAPIVPIARNSSKTPPTTPTAPATETPTPTPPP